MDKKYLDAIKIPGGEKGFTDQNKALFTFVKNPLSMTNKKSFIILGVMMALAVVMFTSENELFRTICSISIVLSFVIFSYLNKDMHYYKKAAKRSFFTDYEKMMKYLSKIIDSNAVYYNDMPAGYLLLKSRKLLEEGNYQEAAKLADVLTEVPKCQLIATYIKALCYYAKGSIEESVPLLQHILMKTKNKLLAKNAGEILELMQ